MADRFPFILILLPFFFLLHNYNDLFGFISARQILFFCLASGIFTIACYLPAYRITRLRGAAAIFTFLVLLFALFFGPYHDFLKSITGRSVISSYKIIVPLSVLIIIIITRYFKNRLTCTTKFLRYLTILMTTVCLVEIVILLHHLYNFKQDKNLIYADKPLCKGYKSCHQPDSTKPDIYFLVLDEYTNNKTLQTIWKFDNGDITSWLATKGFAILSDTKSNYNSTLFSVSATLNMNYISSKKGNKGTIFHNLQGRESLSSNETFCLLREEGYTIRFLAPFSNTIEQNNLSHYFDYLFDERLYQSTLPGRFQRDLLWNFTIGRFSFFKSDTKNTAHLFQQQIKDIQQTITLVKQTADIRENRSPHFVYGHLLITHEPHLFDSAGNVLPAGNDFTGAHSFDTYIQQVQYTNKVIKDLVTYIEQHNKKNTVIIIAGDHGFRRFPPEQSAYNFPNFSAYLFPDKNYSQLYNKMSPVNTFRVVFNHYFCQNFPLLKDSSILVKDYD